MTATVYYSQINTNGGLAGWSQTTALPQPAFSLGAVAAGGLIYAIGGWNSVPTNAFSIAVVSGGGALNAWTAGTALPMALYALGTTVAGSNIFVSGGLGTGNASSSVYSMALPPTPIIPALTAQGLATNGGFQMKLTSTTNTGFGFLASTNFTNWTNIGYGFTGTNGLLFFQDANATAFSNRFYRAYWPLP